MADKYIMPSKILLSQNTECPEMLMIDKPIQPNFSSDDCAVIKKGGFILLDFGKEICGGVALVIQGTSNVPKTGKCRLVFGESVMEALSSIGYKNAMNAHVMRDTVLEIANMGVLRYGNTGFRFLKIEAVECDIFLKAAKAEPDIKDIEYKGSFVSSDERLNKIWETGAYTVHLNMHEFVWDGIKRDRLVWMGDTHPEMSTIKAVFGFDDCIPNSLDFVKAEFPPDKWINNFPSYSMWWIIIHYDWYMQNGNLEYLLNQTEYIRELILNVIKWVEIKDKKREDIFVDWSSKADEQTALIGVYAVIYKALLTAAKIFELAKSSDMVLVCKEAAENIKSMNIKAPNQKQIAGLCAYSGLLDAKEVNEEILSKESLSGLSTFIGYYVLLARAEAGDVEGALDIIRNYWGAMLDFGATTFWEDFDLEWIKNAGRIDEIVPDGKDDIHGDFGKFCYTQFRHSLCHGWASGPTAFLSQYVLGINIAEAGCKKIIVKPNLCDLEWVKGTYPTPYGIISIEHRMENGEVISKIEAPEEIEIEILK